MESPALHRLEEANTLFQSSYKQATDFLSVIADQAAAIHSERRTHAQNLKEELKQWTERAEHARLKGADTDILTERKSYVRELDTEREDLIKEILAGTEQTDQLKRRTEEVNHALSNLDTTSQMLKKRSDEEMPSYMYLRKIFRLVSSVRIVRSDESILEGFVSKKDSEEVLPFRYERSASTFERVNDLWGKILV